MIFGLFRIIPLENTSTLVFVVHVFMWSLFSSQYKLMQTINSLLQINGGPSGVGVGGGGGGIGGGGGGGGGGGDWGPGYPVTLLTMLMLPCYLKMSNNIT